MIWVGIQLRRCNLISLHSYQGGFTGLRNQMRKEMSLTAWLSIFEFSLFLSCIMCLKKENLFCDQPIRKGDLTDLFHSFICLSPEFFFLAYGIIYEKTSNFINDTVWRYISRICWNISHILHVIAEYRDFMLPCLFCTTEMQWRYYWWNHKLNFQFTQHSVHIFGVFPGDGLNTHTTPSTDYLYSKGVTWERKIRNVYTLMLCLFTGCERSFIHFMPLESFFKMCPPSVPSLMFKLAIILF
jgi:hypothetical protein